jgi:hypothetical protein
VAAGEPEELWPSCFLRRGMAIDEDMFQGGKIGSDGEMEDVLRSEKDILRRAKCR